ncbi:MAG: putative zinc-binding metallopeptidase, partial [Acidimicrobiales bacterium]|nr:putative zinc-binding metallopeptidase [Acidimicrobiales bacterium]
GEVPRSDGEDGAFEAVAADWIALAAALNALSRSMGAADLYPFVLAPAVIDKLAYVDSLVRATATA